MSPLNDRGGREKVIQRASTKIPSPTNTCGDGIVPCTAEGAVEQRCLEQHDSQGCGIFSWSGGFRCAIYSNFPSLLVIVFSFYHPKLAKILLAWESIKKQNTLSNKKENKPKTNP